MNNNSLINMYKELMLLKTENAVSQFIEKYGKDWTWKPVGAKENAGIIDMGSEPGDALAERITNGLDALIERKFHEINPPTENIVASPRQAAERWFGIPNGDLSRIDEKARRELAENLVVTFLESGEDKAGDPSQWASSASSPTIEIKDKGIAQHPDRFEKTFLSLNESNKMGKHYLMGAFGQGGSTVYGFGNYSIIISRVSPSLLESGQTDSIGWAIIRRNERDYDQYKKAIYEYCTSIDGAVMRFPKEIIEENFEGSLIRLIHFDLPQQSTVYTAPTGSLWWLSHHCLFDPIMPFLICDKRKERFPSLTETDGRVGKVINGNKFRLSALDKKNNKPKYRSNRWGINLSDLESGRVEVIWWVCENKEDIINFAMKSEPIVVTFNGQRQITISKAELNLKSRDFIKDRIIVQVVGDNLSAQGQRIFSSTRDRARKNAVYVEIVDRLKKALMDDEELKELDKELREKTLAKETSEQEKKAKEMLDKLLERQDKISEKAEKILSKDFLLPVTSPPKKEEVDIDIEERENGKNSQKPIPDIQLHHMPTKIEILNTEQPIIVEKGYRAILNVFIDAVDDYFYRDKDKGEFHIEFENNDLLIEKARSNLRRGKISIRVEADRNAEPNKICNAKLTITRANSEPLIKEIQLKIGQSQQRWRLVSGKKKSPKPNSPQIILVDKTHPAWNTLGWDETDVAEFKDNYVYISKVNRYVDACLKSIKGGEEIINRYISRYGAHMALYTILQKRFEDNSANSLPEGYKKSEMERAARSIINAVIIKLDEVDSSSSF